ncbi:MAG: hypothetical protein KME10_23490 [Plectolyngbya sp. WJT66-NPBG17]|jgi:hypothetical protein|nr:hypothetical protein [Plectolyngbya sp. WJT66-NPBG17]
MLRRKPKDPLPHLPPVSTLDIEDFTQFTRREIAEMFGEIDPSIVSKDCIAMGIKPYEKVPKSDIWSLYVMQCFRRVKPFGHRKELVDLCLTHGDEAAIEYVKLAGGSRADCDHLIEAFIARKQTKPLIV